LKTFLEIFPRYGEYLAITRHTGHKSETMADSQVAEKLERLEKMLLTLLQDNSTEMIDHASDTTSESNSSCTAKAVPDDRNCVKVDSDIVNNNTEQADDQMAEKNLMLKLSHMLSPYQKMEYITRFLSDSADVNSEYCNDDNKDAKDDVTSAIVQRLDALDSMLADMVRQAQLKCEQPSEFSYNEESGLLARPTPVKNDSTKDRNSKHFSCDHCPRTFVQKCGLHKHMKIHTGYTCLACEQVFPAKRDMRKHIQAAHKDEEVMHKCKLCAYKCRWTGSLKLHMARHTGERPFKCDICPKAFSASSNLRVHMLIHTGEKPYQCDKCSYTCKISSSLKSHMKTHTGEKPFSCTLCDYKCTMKSNLKTHLLTHTGQRKFTCRTCNKAFATNGNLKHHMFIHTGEKPYACAKCAFQCNQMSNLRNHMKMYHPKDGLFKCTECKYQCKASDLLKVHMKTHSSKPQPFECSHCDKSFSLNGNLKAHALTRSHIAKKESMKTASAGKPSAVTAVQCQQT